MTSNTDGPTGKGLRAIVKADIKPETVDTEGAKIHGLRLDMTIGEEETSEFHPLEIEDADK